MADADVPDAGDDAVEIVNDERSATAKEQSKALDNVTVHQGEEKQLDASKVKAALAEMMDRQQAAKEAQRQREKELAAVKINSEDVDVIVTELEVDKKSAERRLREHGGVLVDALRSYLS